MYGVAHKTSNDGSFGKYFMYMLFCNLFLGMHHVCYMFSYEKVYRKYVKIYLSSKRKQQNIMK